MISMLPLNDPSATSPPPTTTSTIDPLNISTTSVSVSTPPEPAFSSWTNPQPGESRPFTATSTSEQHQAWIASSYNYTDPVSNLTIRMSMQPVGYFQQVISNSGNGEDIAVRTITDFSVLDFSKSQCPTFSVSCHPSELTPTFLTSGIISVASYLN